MANVGLGVSAGLGLAHGVARAMDHGPQDHIVDWRNVINGPANANFQQLAAKLNMEVRLGETLANFADQFRRLPEGLKPKRDGRQSSGFHRYSDARLKLDLLRELIDVALELRFQTRIAHPGRHGQIVSQRDPQIGKPLQLQTFIARGQLAVDTLENRIVGLGLCQFALESAPGEIFLPTIGRWASGGKTLIDRGGRGLDLDQRVLDVGRSQRVKLLRGGCPAFRHRGGRLWLPRYEILGSQGSKE